jgi:uncharacterized protein (TIGR02001 family)
MKKTGVSSCVLTLVALGLWIAPMNLRAQEEGSSSPFSVGGDLVSSYLWRGTQFGTGPAIQPYLELALGNFTIGGWGSYSFGNSSFAEADIYLAYGFDFGLSIGLTDYYYPGTEYFDYSTETGAHAFELNLGYEIGGFSLAANYIFNEAGNAGSAGSDLYFEAGYGFEYFSLFAGAGDGWHTAEGDFMLCNIGIASEAEINITEKFSLPVSGALIWNPDKEQFHVVVGVSF